MDAQIINNLLNIHYRDDPKRRKKKAQQVHSIRRDLLADREKSTLTSLLVEHLLACWIDVIEAQRLCAYVITAEGGSPHEPLYQTRLDVTHERFLSAVTAFYECSGEKQANEDNSDT